MQPAASSTRLASQTKLLSQLSAVSEATLSGEGDLENLSAYFEPFGSALVPCAPGTRDSIASQESDSLLAAERKEASSCSETEEKEVGLPSKGVSESLRTQYLKKAPTDTYSLWKVITAASSLKNPLRPRIIGSGGNL